MRARTEEAPEVAAEFVGGPLHPLGLRFHLGKFQVYNHETWKFILPPPDWLPALEKTLRELPPSLVWPSAWKIDGFQRQGPVVSDEYYRLVTAQRSRALYGWRP